MESVESPLEVLSRAATMMQHCHNYPASDSDSFESPSTASGGESEGDRTVSPVAPPVRPVTSKELPTAKWRRERRSTRLPDYKPRENGNKALRSQSFTERRGVAAPHVDRPATHSEGESPDEDERPFTSNAVNGGASINGRGAPPEYPSEAPIDMRLKSRPTPPPYPHPAPRASVITHVQQDAPSAGSMSMCDPVIDEHFRRSLGDNYMTLFAKKASEPTPNPKRATKDRGSSPIMFPSDPCANYLTDKQKDTKQNTEENKTEIKKPKESVICEDVAMEIDSASSSVDDHFAKALGDTWKKIQISRLLEKPEDKSDKEKLSRRGVVI